MESDGALKYSIDEDEIGKTWIGLILHSLREEF
jgi:hypothetical protein